MWLKHHYGDFVKILDLPVTNAWLARFCHPETPLNELHGLIDRLYEQLTIAFANFLLPSESAQSPTRMLSKHKDAAMVTTRIPQVAQNIVIVDIIRAGIAPSQICYRLLQQILPAHKIRLDHVVASRKIDSQSHRVIGVDLHAIKVGGPVTHAMLVIPDPMGATGRTIQTVVDYYKKAFSLEHLPIVGLHLIVTPEYLTHVRQIPGMHVLAFRVDRGLSSSDVLATEPGLLWDQEKGLDDTDYIVPGAGGVGELLNNAIE